MKSYSSLFILEKKRFVGKLERCGRPTVSIYVVIDEGEEIPPNYCISQMNEWG